ncbi:MAG: two-component regulator propeller domain-containing protein, partial [Bacteroidota bacterium]
MKTPGIIFWLLLSGCIPAFGQSFIVQNFNTVDGLINPEVYTIYQDQRGFIWFGTDNGLSCFDGQQFLNFEPGRDILGQSVLSLCEDPNNGDLLVGGYKKGLTRIRNQQSQFLPEDTLYFIMGYDLVPFHGRFYESKHSIFHILDPQHDPPMRRLGFYEALRVAPYMVPSIGSATDANIWVKEDTDQLLMGYNVGLFEITETHQLIPYCPGSVGRLAAFEIIQDSENRLFIGGKGEFHIAKDCQILRTISIPGAEGRNVHRMVFDQKGNLWLAIKGAGLFCWDEQMAQPEFMGKQLDILSTNIHYLYIDKEDNLWVGSNESGVYRVQMSLFDRYDGEGDEFCNKSITALSVGPESDLFIGTTKGLTFFQDGHFEHYPGMACNSDFFIYQIKQLSGGRNMVGYSKSLEPTLPLSLKLKPGWNPYRGFGCYQIDESHLLFFALGMPRPQTTRLFKKTGPEEWQLTAVLGEPNRAVDQMWENPYMFEDRKGDLWFSSRTGYLGRIEWDSLEVPVDQWQDSIPFTDLQRAPWTLQMLEGEDGTVYAATESGLGIYQEESWSYFRKEDGLGTDFCTALALDHRGVLWIGTKNGLSSFNGSSIVTYGRLDGLSQEEVTALAFDPKKQYLWIGTNDGLYGVDPENLNDHIPASPEVYVTRLETDTLTYSFPNLLTLPVGEKNVRISYTAPNFSMPKRLEFAYRLGPGEENWKYTTNRNLELSSLAYGSYTFELKARLSEGEWGEIYEMDFYLPAPFWQTIWFVTVVGLLIILGILLGARVRIKRIRNREAEKRELQQKVNLLEQQAMGAMMNPHFIF